MLLVETEQGDWLNSTDDERSARVALRKAKRMAHYARYPTEVIMI